MKFLSLTAIAFFIFLFVNCSSTAKSTQIGNTKAKSVVHIPKDTLQIAPLNIDENQKQLNLVCYENLSRLPGKPIYVSYYDQANRKKIDTTVITGANGIASIPFPAGNDGASSIFRFSLDQAILGTITAIRIPPKSQYNGSGQQSVTIKFDVNMRMQNEGAPVQLIVFPTDGADIPNGGDILLQGSSWPLLR